MTDSQHEPSPSEGEGTHSRPTLFKGPTRKLVFEFLIVLLLFVVPLIVSSVSYLVSPWESSSRSLSSEVYGLIWNLGAIGLLLYFARSHGQDLRILGLRKSGHKSMKESVMAAFYYWS